MRVACGLGAAFFSQRGYDAFFGHGYADVICPAIRQKRFFCQPDCHFTTLLLVLIYLYIYIHLTGHK